MPLPKTEDVGKVLKVLKDENKHKSKKRSRAQMIAIALKQTGKSKYS